MKKLITACIAILLTTALMAQQKKEDFTKLDPSRKVQKAEVSCGECKFKMKGDGCHLAVRLNGKSYWVSNADVDDFGNAHDKNGFCKAIRKADIQGEIKNGKYELTYLKFIK